MSVKPDRYFNPYDVKPAKKMNGFIFLRDKAAYKRMWFDTRCLNPCAIRTRAIYMGGRKKWEGERKVGSDDVRSPHWAALVRFNRLRRSHAPQVMLQRVACSRWGRARRWEDMNIHLGSGGPRPCLSRWYFYYGEVCVACRCSTQLSYQSARTTGPDFVSRPSIGGWRRGPRVGSLSARRSLSVCLVVRPPGGERASASETRRAVEGLWVSRGNTSRPRATAARCSEPSHAIASRFPPRKGIPLPRVIWVEKNNTRLCGARRLDVAPPYAPQG